MPAPAGATVWRSTGSSPGQPVIPLQACLARQGTLGQRQTRKIAATGRLTQTYLEQINATAVSVKLPEFFRNIAYRHPGAGSDPAIPRASSSRTGHQRPVHGQDFLQRLWQTRSVPAKPGCGTINSGPAGGECRSSGAARRTGRDGHPTSGQPLRTGAQRGAAVRRSFGWMARCVCSVCCGRCSKTAGRCCSKNRNCPARSRRRAVAGAVRRAASAQGRGAGKSIVTTHSEDLLRDPGIAAGKCSGCDRPLLGTLIHQPGDKERLLMQQGMMLTDAVLPLSRPDGARTGAGTGAVLDRWPVDVLVEGPTGPLSPGACLPAVWRSAPCIRSADAATYARWHRSWHRPPSTRPAGPARLHGCGRTRRLSAQGRSASSTRTPA